MSCKQLQRRGFSPNPDKIKSKGSHRLPGAILARRARKEWPCVAEDCDLPAIEWDEVYVEVSEPSTFRGPDTVRPSKRYHMSCAVRQELIVKDGGVDVTNNRRAAVAMTKARMG